MSLPVTAMIFAAGFGTRMGERCATRPKALLEVGGAPLIQHALRHAADAGVAEVVVNLHYRAEQVQARLTGWARPRLRFSPERPEILDTGGGLRAAGPLLGEDPVVALNSDAVWQGENPLAPLEAAWRGAEMDALLLLVPRSQALCHPGTGDFAMAPDGRLTRRGEAAEAPYVYTGAQILRTAGLEAFAPGAFSLNVLWDRMLAAGRLYGAVYPGRWVDVGTGAGLAMADRLLRA
ncbi:MAG: nucleotidyltransferase family protein [Pseudomonadota bacterium]